MIQFLSRQFLILAMTLFTFIGATNDSFAAKVPIDCTALLSQTTPATEIYDAKNQVSELVLRLDGVVGVGTLGANDPRLKFFNKAVENSVPPDQRVIAIHVASEDIISLYNFPSKHGDFYIGFVVTLPFVPH